METETKENKSDSGYQAAKEDEHCKTNSDRDILEIVKNDLKRAKSAKTIIDKRISGWNDDYDGKKYGNEVEGRSSIVIRDIAKQIEAQKPNITEPFTSTPNPIGVAALNARSDKAADFSETTLNYQFTNEFDRYKFISNIGDILPREGTVWVRTAWIFKEEEEVKKLDGVPMEQILQIPDEPSKIEVSEQPGLFNVEYKRMKTLVNKPDAKVLRNEDCFPDPLADHDDGLEFFIYREKLSYSDLRQNSHFDQAVVKSLRSGDGTDYSDSSLGADRDAELEDYGKSEANLNGATDRAREKYTVYHYWGNIDMTGNGITEPVVFVWIDKDDKILQYEANYLPGKKIPFVGTPYSAKPFSAWGNALAYFIGDNQKVRTMIMRGMLDNVSLSNNGQKFIQKGTLDYVNWKRLTNGSKYIQINKLDGMVDGSFNQLPQSIFALYDNISQDSESLTGISKMQQGLDPGSMGNTAAGVQTLASMSQKRMGEVVRNISNLLSKVMTRWNDYNVEFLDNTEIENLIGDKLQVSGDDLKKDFDIAITVATDSSTQAKVQQYNLMLQQSASMAGSIPPQLMNMIYSKMLYLFQEPAMAEMVKNYQPQPDPKEEKMFELEIGQKTADIQDTQANAQYKQANAGSKAKDIQKSDAEIDSMDMDTTLKPMNAQVENMAKLMPKPSSGQN